MHWPLLLPQFSHDATGFPFIFEVRDISPETYIALGYMHRYSPYSIFLAMLEKWLCRRASRVISVIPGYADYLSERKIRAPEVVHIPNASTWRT